MLSEWQGRFLKHLPQNKKVDGFTLIELLVTIIIIGILSAIALPTFLGQANKAKQTEAKIYVGSMNRAQQSYYLEQSTFANQANFSNLGLGIPTQTNYYRYAIAGSGTLVTNQAQVPSATSPLKAYLGGVEIYVDPVTNEVRTRSRLCEGIKGRRQGGPDGTEVIQASGGGEDGGGDTQCPNLYTEIGG